MKADALWSPQVVVADVTCGGAPYSIGPLKILERRRANLGKRSDCKDKEQPNGLIT
jgi:hypothetical protein